jgi:hypothetical protein
VTPLTAALCVAALLVAALATAGLWATARLRRAETRVRQQAERIARLRAELELARLETAAARAPRLGLAAAARSRQTKPLPRFVHHDPARHLAREG